MYVWGGVQGKQKNGSSIIDRAAEKKYVVWMMILLMAVMLIFAGYKMLSYLPTDLGEIYSSVREILEDGHVSTEISGEERFANIGKCSNNAYFLIHPHNIPILVYLTTYFRMIHAFGIDLASDTANFCGALLSVASILVSVIAGMYAADSLYGKRGKVLYVLMAVFFVPYYLHASFYYTDVLSLPFVALAVLFFVRENGNRMIRVMLSALFLGIAFLLKGSAIVLLVSILIYMMLQNRKNIKWLTVFLVSFLVVKSIWGWYQPQIKWIDYTDADHYEFPVTHWMMMGLNQAGTGGFFQSDFEFTSQFETKSEKQIETMKMIRERLASFDSIGSMLVFEIKKASYTWSDGQFFQNEHIELGKNQGKIYDWITVGGKYREIYGVYIATYILVIYLLIIIGGSKYIAAPKVDRVGFLHLTVLGVIVFFMIWESKSRYLLNYTPIFFLAAIHPILGEKKKM